MNSANRTRRVYEAKTLFLWEAGEGERRGLLILKPVFLRNFGCCGWPSIATKHVKKNDVLVTAPLKISLSSSGLYSEFFDVGKASLSVGRRWVEIVVQQDYWNLKCIITMAVNWVAGF